MGPTHSHPCHHLSQLGHLPPTRSGLGKTTILEQPRCNCVSAQGRLSGSHVVLSVRWLIVRQAFRLECVCEVNGLHRLYPTFLAFLIQALDQDVSHGFRHPHRTPRLRGAQTAAGIFHTQNDHFSILDGVLILWRHSEVIHNGCTYFGINGKRMSIPIHW